MCRCVIMCVILCVRLRVCENVCGSVFSKTKGHLFRSLVFFCSWSCRLPVYNGAVGSSSHSTLETAATAVSLCVFAGSPIACHRSRGPQVGGIDLVAPCIKIGCYFLLTLRG